MNSTVVRFFLVKYKSCESFYLINAVFNSFAKTFLLSKYNIRIKVFTQMYRCFSNVVVKYYVQKSLCQFALFIDEAVCLQKMKLNHCCSELS